MNFLMHFIYIFLSYYGTVSEKSHEIVLNYSIWLSLSLSFSPSIAVFMSFLTSMRFKVSGPQVTAEDAIVLCSDCWSVLLSVWPVRLCVCVCVSCCAYMYTRGMQIGKLVFVLALFGSNATAGEGNPADQLHPDRVECYFLLIPRSCLGNS